MENKGRILLVDDEMNVIHELKRVLTGQADINVPISAINEGGIFRYISTPWDNLQVITMVAEGMALKRETDEINSFLQPAGDQSNGSAYLKGEKQNKRFRSTETLSNWEKKLEGLDFFRCHRSFIVNINKIEKITPWFHGAFNLKLEDVKESIPVSRNASKELKELIEL